MLKFVNTDIVFQEIPDETTLAINLSGCPCHCPGCHSKYLWEDIGEELTPETLDDLIERQSDDITCVSFMGGDADPEGVAALAHHIRAKHPNLKVSWWSGRQYFPRLIDRDVFDYLKQGPYIAHLGPLKSPRTNQRLYKKEADGWQDITHRFQKK